MTNFSRLRSTILVPGDFALETRAIVGERFPKAREGNRPDPRIWGEGIATSGSRFLTREHSAGYGCLQSRSRPDNLANQIPSEPAR